MASIHRRIGIERAPADVWDALRDVGALHTRLVRGFVTECRLDGEVRHVRFANGVEAREQIVDVDAVLRRVAWSATGGRLAHHHASAQVLARGDAACEVVWIADLLPHALAPAIATMIEQGLAAMKRTLEEDDGGRQNGAMTVPALDAFIAEAGARSRARPDPADCVLALAPLMLDLIDQAGSFLEPRHYRSSPAGYSRNLIFDAPDASLSLYAIVWLPGQWTPVHDHGSWGVVGVVEGVLEERSYVRRSPDRGADTGIELARGGTVLLRHGAVTSFVPNPDHIHVTGVPSERARAVSLHLYGRTMSDFNLYDVGAGTRRRIHVAHNES